MVTGNKQLEKWLTFISLQTPSTKALPWGWAWSCHPREVLWNLTGREHWIVARKVKASPPGDFHAIPKGQGFPADHQQEGKHTQHPVRWLSWPLLANFQSREQPYLNLSSFSSTVPWESIPLSHFQEQNVLHDFPVFSLQFLWKLYITFLYAIQDLSI